MGYPNTELIAPALLWMNPGITREELGSLLRETPSSGLQLFQEEDPFTVKSTHGKEWHLFSGVDGLAKILGLQPTPKKRQRGVDEHGLPLYNKKMSLNFHTYKPPTYIVSKHLRNELEEVQQTKTLSSKQLRPGTHFEDQFYGTTSGIIKEVLSKEKTTIDDMPVWCSEVRMTPYHAINEYEEYEEREAMVGEHPEFAVDKLYDWSQEEGGFVGLLTKGFRWQQTNRQYYLDEETFRNIPAGFVREDRQLGYTELVTTKEALKHNATKVLSYKGRRYIDDFLETFPEAKNAYDQAVWDGHTSIYAKKQRMTNTQFLRLRVEAGIE